MEDCGGEDYVTPEAMRVHFKSEAWAALEDEESTLYRFITSIAFKREGLEAKQIDRQALSMFAMLHCPGDLPDRCEHFFNEL